MKSRGQKALLNTVVLAMYEVVTFACGLILPRYILKYFGSEFNGITSSITQFLGFIVILQMGIGGSTRFALYKKLANNDNYGISGIINATERYMRKVGIALLVYIGLMVIFYPHIAKTTVSATEVRWLVLILGASSFAQYFFGITYQILLIADQRQYIYYIIVSVATIINAVVAVLLMVTGNSIFVVKLGGAIIFVAIPVILYYFVKRLYNIDKSVQPDSEGLKGRWDVMWHSVANIVHTNSSLVILTLFADVKLVSVYTVYYLVVNGMYKILSVFTSSLEAAFGNMFAKNEKENAYKHLENYEFFMSFFVSVVFSCALVLIVPFVKIYTKGITDVNYVQPLFATLAVVAQMIMCIRQPYLTVVQAAGHYKQTRNGAFFEAGLNLAVSLIFTYKLGLIGVVLGTLSANLFRTLQYAFYLRKNILDRPFIKPLMMMIFTFLNVTVICILCMIVINQMSINTWTMWLVAGVICALIAGVVTLVTSLIFYRKKLFTLFKMLKSMVRI